MREQTPPPGPRSAGEKEEKEERGSGGPVVINDAAVEVEKGDKEEKEKGIFITTNIKGARSSTAHTTNICAHRRGI
ncbi:hypothetical protein E2C01_096501 [Portunus trituberculatus]|uniref:Uncharacterized protein n=1 Tax=Portunus trituberculatus TaxID=210409 RepID=A0A5B7JVS6_PORTR|nr:hypothetical protein [Portunus trituberculatus]